MKLYSNYGGKQGFSLIELMAVIAVIGILITLVSPQVSKARLRGRLTEQAVKARSIVEAITAKETGNRFSCGWPQSGDGEDAYTSSTAYLRELVEEGYLDVDFSWFAGPGMQPARSAGDFSEANNAWCILIGVNDTTPGNTPVVFLKNLNAESGQFSENALPFGNRGFAFATKNGEATAIHEGEIRGGDWTSIFTFPEGVSVNILHP